MCEMTDREIAESALTLICAVASSHAENGMGNPILYNALEATLHLANHLEPDEDTQELLDIIQTSLIEQGEAVNEAIANGNALKQLLDEKGLTFPE